MDTTTPYAPETTPTQSVTLFTPIKILFEKSWERVQKYLLQLFLLNILFFVGVIVSSIATGLIFYLTGFFSNASTNSYFTSIPGITALTFTAIMAILGGLAVVILQIATILLLSETIPGGPGILQLMRMGSKKLFPMIILSIITNLMIIGGLVLFIVPGILFGILVFLSPYLLVLDNLSPLEAIRRSVSVVSKNFGAIFTRLLVINLVSILAWVILNILSSQAGLISWVSYFGSLIFNLIFNWIFVAYVLFIHQDTKKVTNTGSSKIAWMLIVASIGWIILIGGGFLLYSTYSNTSTSLPTIQPNNFTLDEFSTIATPAASIRPLASPSPSIRPSSTPAPSTTPKATNTTTTSTPSANR